MFLYCIIVTSAFSEPLLHKDVNDLVRVIENHEEEDWKKCYDSSTQQAYIIFTLRQFMRGNNQVRD